MGHWILVAVSGVCVYNGLVKTLRQYNGKGFIFVVKMVDSILT